MIYKRQGKMIGKLDGGIYKKTVSAKKHKFNKLDAWGVDDSILQELPEETRIEIFDKDTKTVFVTTAREFRQDCTYLEFSGYGLQGFLPLEKFRQESLTAKARWN